MNEKILTLHPAGKSGVRIDRGKYDAVRAVLEAIVTAGAELPHAELTYGVEKALRGRFEGSIPWYTEAVKLDLEARGVLVRVAGPVGPRWKRGTKAARARRTASVAAPGAEVRGILDELRRLGSEQNQAAYRQQGVEGETLGVSSAALGRLRKRIKWDHALALGLWGTGVHDARVLATMIANPAELEDRTVDAWVRDLDNCVLADAFGKLVAASPLARARMERWVAAKGEWAGRTGWNLVSLLAMNDRELSDGVFEPYLARIERDVRFARSRVRSAMMQALAAIARRGPALEAAAIAAARRIGKIEVDDGETGDRTPDPLTALQGTVLPPPPGRAASADSAAPAPAGRLPGQRARHGDPPRRRR
jgi:3-methyladenine DNA glycosylase AlkD